MREVSLNPAKDRTEYFFNRLVEDAQNAKHATDRFE